MGKKNQTQQIERRFLPVTGLELRAEDGKPSELIGYASVFNTPANIMDLWLEEVAPGAFTKTISEADIRALFNHDPNIVLGRNRAGTLALNEDAHGLQVRIQPPDNEWGRPVLDAVKRGDISGMSIAFRAVKQEWYRPEPGSKDLPKRTIREARLYDVSPVTYPAFEATSVAARAAGMSEDEASELLTSWLKAAEPGIIVHSAAVHTEEPAGPDPDHSAAVRARMLELLKLSL